MRSPFDRSLAAVAVVAGALGFAAAHWSSAARPTRAAPPPAVSSAPAASVGQMSLPDFADIAERANPAVVGISSSEPGSERRAPDDPFHWFLPRGPRGERMPQRSMGTGFLISEDGYVFTNNHVVERASKVQVKLADDTTLEARVIGRDPEIDVALLKVEPPRPLPALPLGDSDRARPGEWVCAIGNPLLYEHTVTVGVVSAKGRRLERNRSLESYIQTDAAINFGNSGGPLLNARGEVIGINTAISSQGQNIGFAVPINLAKESLPQLKAKGRVDRGYLGIELQPLDAAMRRAFDLEGTDGVLVANVGEGSAAARAGIEAGDVLIEFGGERIANPETLVRLVSRRSPGERVRIRLVRDGAVREVEVELGTRPAADAGEEKPDRPAGETPEGSRLGIAVADLLPRVRAQFEIPEGIEGVAVVRVDPDGPAGNGALEPGDVILEVDRKPVRSVAELKRALAAVETGDDVLLYVLRSGRRFWQTVEAGE